MMMLVEEELRTVEHLLIYMEASIKGFDCNNIFIGHYEHLLTFVFFSHLSKNRKIT